MIKTYKHYEVKTLPMSVKDIDTKTRRVKMALAAFNNMDSDRDVIRKGAFAKSIQERGPESMSNRKIAHLRHHDWEHQIGKFISMEETDQYLIGLSELGRSTSGEDAFLDYQDGIIMEHSIGFNYVQDKKTLQGEGEHAYFEIKEVILWEGSAVTFGANSLTPTLDVSKGNKMEVIEKINKKMNTLIGALKNGKGTDDRLYQIEMGLKVCQEQYNSLIESVPAVGLHNIDKPNEQQERESRAKELMINLIKN